MYILTFILPLSLFLFSSLFGRWIGYNGIYRVGIIGLSSILIISIIILKEIFIDNNVLIIHIGNWLNIDLLNIQYNYILDDISSIMLIVVISISLIVYIYTYDYMKDDPHGVRFYVYINLFVLSMIILITTTSLPILFIGWEGVGLSSFLLISYWYNRIEASLGGILAFSMNRIGDIFFILGILLSLLFIGSIDLLTILSYPHINTDIILIFFLFAAMAKSAQLFLHIWLPYSMEGPTPISALIHAATMVTAGIILLIRLSILISYSYFTLILILFIGSLTALIGGTLAITSLDMKELIAYSTMSQLGYMVTILGLQSSNLSFYHLVNHAYFKALLFLTAGSIIHLVFDIQDMRKSGGLLYFLPISYLTLFIGLISLSGLPFTTGFYSKESLLNISSYSYLFLGELVYWILLLSAFFTIYYSYGLLIKLFYKTTRLSLFILNHLHYYSLHLTLSLSLLSIITIFFGYITFKFIYFFDFHFNFYNLQLPLWLKSLPILFFFIITFIYIFFKSNSLIRISLFEGQYFFKEFYKSIAGSLFSLSYRILFKIFDYGIIDLLGPITSINIHNISKSLLIKSSDSYFPLILLFLFLSLYLL